MSSFPILDLVVGIIFVYFLLSINTSSAVELWFSILKTRARLLERWLVRIFNLPALSSSGIPLIDADGQPVSLGREIMNHCMVTGLSKSNTSTSYIDAKNFVSALLDKITLLQAAPGTNQVQFPPTTLAQYITAIQNSTVISGELKRTILLYANEAAQAASVINNIPANVSNSITTVKSELDHFRDRLEKWYDTNADRLTGTLKRTKVFPATFVLATIMTISLNTDSIEISKYLYKNEDVSKQLATTAMDNYNTYRGRVDTLKKAVPAIVVTDSTANTSEDTTGLYRVMKSKDQLKNDIQNLQALDLPLGWSGTNVTDAKSFWNYFSQWKHLVGWLATILAICMGAPFWFDVLGKVANIRGAGPKPASSSDADSKSS
ncbi:MAG: hypothetical protein M3015_02475 [Bacteroidota bacterium]|nr:hypothetical protein [Bacteroidota bacterium]